MYLMSFYVASRGLALTSITSSLLHFSESLDAAVGPTSSNIKTALIGAADDLQAVLKIVRR